MFFNRFTVSILSSDTKTEALLSRVPQPEDSAFDIKTYSRPEDIVVASSSGNAVIADCISFPDLQADIFNAEAASESYIVLIVSADNIPVEEQLEKASDLWVMPSPADGECCERLIRTGFKRLMDNMISRADSRRTEICLSTAIDSVPDLVWFKDSRGAHLNVNNAFCKAVEKTKSQIYKKGHYYIWDIPKSEYDQGDYVCLESEDIVIGKISMIGRKKPFPVTE